MPRERSEERTYIPRQIKHAVLQDCQNRCAHCGKLLVHPEKPTLEHVIPLNKGGNNEITNLVALCETCNKSKSDDIVDPSDYYKFLPKEKLKQVQQVFQKYMKTVTWLSNDTLLRLDQFNFNVPLTLLPKAGGRKIITVPISINVRKLRKPDAAEWLLFYASRLKPDEKELIPYEEKSMVVPYYKVASFKEDICVIAPYIEKVNFSTPVCQTAKERNILLIDVFFHPSVKKTPEFIEMCSRIMENILDEIHRTLSYHAPKTAIELLIRTPKSDAIGEQVFRCFGFQHKQSFVSYVSYEGTDENPMAQIACLNTIAYQGDKKDPVYQKLTDRIQTTASLDISDMQKQLDDELKKSKAIIRPNQMPHVTKSDKKKRHKKKGKPKR